MVFISQSFATKYNMITTTLVEYILLPWVLSLNNPQNCEMIFMRKYEVDMLEIVTIIVGYTQNNFTTHATTL
jgi:hypothetical protein